MKKILLLLFVCTVSTHLIAQKTKVQKAETKSKSDLPVNDLIPPPPPPPPPPTPQQSAPQQEQPQQPQQVFEETDVREPEESSFEQKKPRGKGRPSTKKK